MKEKPQSPILRILLLVVLFLAFWVRIYRLDAQSLWYDEAVTAQVAAKGIAELTRWTADDIQPPLYYYVMAGWTRLAGRSEWALRFPSAFFGVLTVALLWAVARRLFGGAVIRAGAVAADHENAPLAGPRRTSVEVSRTDAHTGRNVTADENGRADAIRPYESGIFRTDVTCGARRTRADESPYVPGIFQSAWHVGGAIFRTDATCGAGRTRANENLRSDGFSRLAHPVATKVATTKGGIFRTDGYTVSGLAAAGLAAFLPLYVYYAQEARMYTLLTFLGVLAGYALLRVTWSACSLSHIAYRISLIAYRISLIAYRLSRIVDRRSLIADGNTRYAIRNTEYGIRNTQYAIRNTSWWLVFVTAAAALLYTHYFGIFLLMAYALCFLVTWLLRFRSSASGHARLRSILSFGIAVLAIGVLYLPWLPAMLNRYQVDASYWPGELKLGEALRHVAINFTVAAPEMMLEDIAVRFLPVYGIAVALALTALVWRGRHVAQAGVLLGVLLLPVIAVLLLASRTPKFNPRYLMLASPAYVLILAGGIGDWGLGIRDWVSGIRGLGMHTRGRATRLTSRNPQSLIPGLLALSLLFFVLIASLASLRNWFSDPAFTKAQWREVAATVRQERAPDEAVLLVSGHAYPAWDYYAADIPVARLPDIDILDVNAVLGFEVGPVLTQALADMRGAWLVTWQDEVVDPMGIVPHLLARGGRELSVERQFWHVGLRHWQFPAGVVYGPEPQPQNVHPANFDHKLALLGWDEPQGGQIAVYWRCLNTLLADYQVSIVLEDAQGRELGRWDGRPAGYGYPTTRWRPGQALLGRYPLPRPTAKPVGDLHVTLAVYSLADPSGLDLRDVADNPAGKRVRIGPLQAP